MPRKICCLYLSDLPLPCLSDENCSKMNRAISHCNARLLYNLTAGNKHRKSEDLAKRKRRIPCGNLKGQMLEIISGFPRAVPLMQKFNVHWESHLCVRSPTALTEMNVWAAWFTNLPKLVLVRVMQIYSLPKNASTSD